MNDRQPNHDKQKPKILVTGITGYIGSRVATFLDGSHACFCHHPNALPEGEGTYDICGLTRGGCPSPQPSPKRRGGGVTYIQGDFGDTAVMIKILTDIKPNIIIHCAGVTPHQGVSAEDYDCANYGGGKNLIKAILDSGLRRNDGFMGLINCSTIGVYGAPQSHNGFVHEDDLCAALSPYAQSKYDFEQVLNTQKDIQFLNFRIVNIPGRDAFLNHVMDNGRVEFYGDAPYVRDYIHLDDLCALFALGVDYLIRGGAPMTLNAGSGVGYGFPDLVDELERQTGNTITRVQKPAKPRDVQQIICDISSAKVHLNWQPKKTDIKEIIEYALHNQQL